MKSKNTAIIMVLATMFVLVGNPGEVKAQDAQMSLSEMMEKYITKGLC